MDWSNDLCLQLIKHYKTYRCLWDPTYTEYRNYSKKKDAWNALGNIMNCGVDEVRKKMESLLASYRRERQKCLQPRTSRVLGSSPGRYKSKWFAYNSMQFLMKSYKPRPIIRPVHSIPNNTVEPDITLKVEDGYETPDTINIDDYDFTQRMLPSPPRQTELETPRKEQSQRRISDYPTVEDLYKLVKETISNHDRDESSIFGEFVAMKHRKFSGYTRSIVEHSISKIIFDAEMGKFNEPQSQPSTSSIHIEPEA